MVTNFAEIGLVGEDNWMSFPFLTLSRLLIPLPRTPAFEVLDKTVAVYALSRAVTAFGQSTVTSLMIAYQNQSRR